MFSRSILIFVVLVAAAFTASVSVSYAQSVEDRTSSLLNKPGDEDKDKPRTVRESLEKMRIEQEKKEYSQMLARGEEALKLSEQLETAFAQNGKLTDADQARIANIEKLAKKIRNELGGSDGDDDKERQERKTLSPSEAVKSLRSMTVSLYEELKKTSRFSISAAAIESTNALLKITRFLRITN
jgi:hypothetical protein